MCRLGVELPNVCFSIARLHATQIHCVLDYFSAKVGVLEEPDMQLLGVVNRMGWLAYTFHAAYVSIQNNSLATTAEAGRLPPEVMMLRRHGRMELCL